MKTSRRSLFGLFGGAVAAGSAIAVATPATADTRQRKYRNGVLICRCEAPEFDVSTEQRVSFEHVFVGRSGGSGAHSHTISERVPVWITATLKHCIFCGGSAAEVVA